MKTRTLIIILFIFLVGLNPGIGNADDFEWPHWRGPDRNGISRETDWNPEALTGGPEVLWHVNIGMGYSDVAIRDGRLYTMGVTNEGEFVLCLDALTGDEIWRYNYDEPHRYPQATPTIDGKYIYALSYEGVVLCLKAKNGKLKWKRDLVEDFGASRPDYGYASSPAVEGDLIVFNSMNTGIAMNKLTGDTVWEGEVPTAPTVIAWSTSVFYDHNGRRCVLIFSFPGLFSLDLETGKQLWYYEWMKGLQTNVADPVLFNGKVFISWFETFPLCAVLDIGGPEPKLLWENHDLENHVSTSVYLDGYLYGFDGNQSSPTSTTISCLAAETGELIWKEKTGGGSLTATAGKLIVLTAKGTLHIAEANPTAYREVSSCDLPSEKGYHKWWTPPVLCNGKIYCRNYYGDLVCINVSK